MSLEVHRGDRRFLTPGPDRPGRERGVRTEHSFSFGRHYDPANVGFAAMVAHNDEHLPAGSGYPDHPHRDLEIVTWVLEGVLLHTDSGGRSTRVPAGAVQRISAGSGIVHAELAADGGPARFLQTWLRPDLPGAEPRYALSAADPDQSLTTVIGPGSGVEVAVAGARFAAGRVGPGALRLPADPLLHLFVVDAALVLSGAGGPAVRLGPGDAVRISGPDRPGLEVEVAGRIALWGFGR